MFPGDTFGGNTFIATARASIFVEEGPVATTYCLSALPGTSPPRRRPGPLAAHGAAHVAAPSVLWTPKA